MKNNRVQNVSGRVKKPKIKRTKAQKITYLINMAMKATK